MPVIRAGEPPLVVFISSVMDDEMEQPRADAVEALDRPRFLAPWAFEFTPASQAAADETYLEKAAGADALIWLVGSRTTEPVRREIQTARENEVPIFVIRIQDAVPDAATKAQIAELGMSVKWATVPADQVREAVALSIGDALVQAWRDNPGRGRGAILEERGRLSRARSIARWMATGLTRLHALTFADDLAVGRPDDSVRPTPEHPLRVIVGDVGSGKTMTGERLLQEAVAEAIGDADARVPVWLAARDAQEDLVGMIVAASAGVGDVRRQGAFVVIDGADEVGSSGARSVLTEARIAVEALPGTLIVVTTRPLPVFDGAPERVELPPLSEDEGFALISSVVGQRVIGHAWPPAVSDAIKRPLFALLLADWLRHRQDLPASSGELLRGLVERAAPSDQVETNALLRRLATLSTDRGDAPVAEAEVGTADQVAGLIDSRLVVRTDDSLSFALPAYTQWFAAQAIQAGEVVLREVAADPIRLDLWRYALIIVIGQLDFERVSDLLEPLVEAEPGFASQVIAASMREYEQPQSARDLDLTAIEAARRIRRAAASWLRGLEEVQPLLRLTRADGSLLPLGAYVDGPALHTAWYRGDSQGHENLELPPGYVPMVAGPDWGPGRMSRPVAELAWPWRWSLHDIVNGLKPWIAQQLLPIGDGPLFEEAAWTQALALTRRGSLTREPLPLSDIESALSQLPAGARVRVGRNAHDLTAIRVKLAWLLAQDAHELSPPWPSADLEPQGPWVWSSYSPQQLLARTSAVYEAALRGYVHLVKRWLPRVGTRLTTYATLPATAKGMLFFDKSATDFTGGPLLQWLLQPVEQAQPTTVQFELREERANTFLSEELRALHEEARTQLARLRPTQRHWLHILSQGTFLEVFEATPATNLAYKMLLADLKSINLS